MTHLADHDVAGPVRAVPRLAPRKATRRVRCRDARWSAVASALAALRAARRRSVRIVDADCGDGALLLCAVRHARTLGFTAIEARGIDDAADGIERARATAARLHDCGIGIDFEIGDVVKALREEADFPADIILWHGRDACSAAQARAVMSAGRIRIADPDAPR